MKRQKSDEKNKRIKDDKKWRKQEEEEKVEEEKEEATRLEEEEEEHSSPEQDNNLEEDSQLNSSLCWSIYFNLAHSLPPPLGVLLDISLTISCISYKWWKGHNKWVRRLRVPANVCLWFVA